MTRYYVAAIRDWPEDRMYENFEHVTELGTELQSTYDKYKTLRGVIKYGVQEHVSYFGHAWAMFEQRGMYPFTNDKFVGVEYNPDDAGLAEIATRYMRVRNRLHRNTLISPVPLCVKVGVSA